MPLPYDLRLHFHKHRDGRTSLAAERRDGSRTWAPLVPGFGIRHDLAHFVVETELPLRQAFYGLLADGWDITSFETPGTAGSLPDEALLAEAIVSLLLVETSSPTPPALADVNGLLAQQMENMDRTLTRPLTDLELARIRERLVGEIAAWDALPDDGVLVRDITW